MQLLQWWRGLRVGAWADRRLGGGGRYVCAVVLTGSAVTGAQHALSDRDVELHARDTSVLEAEDSWWRELGDVLAVERMENGGDRPTRLVYFVGGKIDFTLIHIADQRGSYDRPFRVLLDKDGVASEFTLAAPLPEVPDQEPFDECCHWFAAAALMEAKAIVRDETLSEMIRDVDLKAQLLRMIEWDHNARYGTNPDVRYLGTRMRQWMDPDVQHRLEDGASVFGRDNRDALMATIVLLRRAGASPHLQGGSYPVPDAARQGRNRAHSELRIGLFELTPTAARDAVTSRESDPPASFRAGAWDADPSGHLRWL